MKRIQLLMLCVLLSIGAKGQVNPKYRNYEWDSNPKLHTLTAKEQKMDELVLREKQAVEFIFEKKGKVVYAFGLSGKGFKFLPYHGKRIYHLLTNNMKEANKYKLEDSTSYAKL